MPEPVRVVPGVETETIDPNLLTPHPRNYRSHPEDQIQHLIHSLEENGFYRNVVVARGNVILAGHGVITAAKRIELPTVPIVRLDIDPNSPQALRLLAGDNYIAQTAFDDDRALAEVLKELAHSEEDGSGLQGTGFDAMMLANFVMVTRHEREVGDFDAAAEWVGAGMPEHNHGHEPIKLVVEFDNVEDRAAFLEMIEVPESKVFKRGKGGSFWWPLRERHDRVAVRTEAEEAPSDEA